MDIESVIRRYDSNKKNSGRHDRSSEAFIGNVTLRSECRIGGGSYVE